MFEFHEDCSKLTASWFQFPENLTGRPMVVPEKDGERFLFHPENGIKPVSGIANIGSGFWKSKKRE